MAPSQLMQSLADLSNTLIQEKAAAQRKGAAATPADPGGQHGASTHPSASVDNNCQKSTEGPRSAENEKDVKEQEKAPSVNNATAPSPTADQQGSVQYNAGLRQSATGEDPSVEDDYKDNKTDPGTEHPADVEDNVKYGSLSIKEAHALASIKGNAILADIAVGFGDRITDPKPAKQAAAPAVRAAAVTPPAADAALSAGYELAATLGLSKEAAQSTARDTLLKVAQDASFDADLLAGYLKQAALEEEGDSADASSDGGDGPAETAGGPEPLVGGGGEGGAPPAEAGGAPPADMGGGMGGDPAAGGAGGAGGQEAALQELVSALVELGIPPDQLLQAVAGGGGGGGDPAAMGGNPAMGGAPPMDPMAGDPAAAGGMPPDMGMPKAAAFQRLAEIGHVARNFQRSGRYHMKAAGTKKALENRNHFKQHILELLNTING